MRRLFAITLLLLASPLSAQPLPENPPPDAVVTYKQIGDVELKLHVFNPPGHSVSDPRPAIVFFFGGGWKHGTPGQFYPQCEYLASRGMVAISAEYRVRTRHGTSPRECVQDGKSAVRWIRAHADDLGINPNQLAAGGGSAGGHVAAATATLLGFDEAGEDDGISCIPQALVLFNPVFDNGPGGYGHERVNEYWREFSPLHNIREGMPPAIVFLGTEDTLIPVATAEDFRQRMIDAGSASVLHLYQGQPHGFFNRSKSEEHFIKTMVEADRFLADLGYLQGKPTLATEPPAN